MPRPTRRALLAGGAGVVDVLAAPALVRVVVQTTLRFSPQRDLIVFDPVATTTYASRNHGYMVYDPLLGMGSSFQLQPQMLAAYRVEHNGKQWEPILHDGLLFHHASKVLERDCVASLRRWAKRNPVGGTLMDATDELSTPDDRTIRVRWRWAGPVCQSAP